jgi:hypothetical protein
MSGAIVRNRRLLYIIAVLLPLCISLSGGAVWLDLFLKDQRLRGLISRVQLELENYAARNGGVYPKRIEDILPGSQLLELPQNPYSAKAAEVLSPLDPPRSGELVYMAYGPLIALGPGRLDDSNITYREYDHYVLGVYGRINARQRAQFEARVAEYLALAKDDTQRVRMLLPLGGRVIGVPLSHLPDGEEVVFTKDYLPGYSLLRFSCGAGIPVRPGR